MKTKIEIEFNDEDPEERIKILLDREQIFFCFYDFINDLFRYIDESHITSEQRDDINHKLRTNLHRYDVELENYHY